MWSDSCCLLGCTSRQNVASDAAQAQPAGAGNREDSFFTFLRPGAKIPSLAITEAKVLTRSRPLEASARPTRPAATSPRLPCLLHVQPVYLHERPRRLPRLPCGTRHT